MPTPPFAAHRRGISLMEVLVAIGILSIGLLSMLALLPAGRTYLVKADVEDQAAALVPNAISMLESWGLFREDALEWRTIRADNADDGEPVAWRSAWDQTDAERWQKDAATSAVIRAWHEPPPPDPAPFTIAGKAGDKQTAVTLEITRNGKPFQTTSVNSDQDGNWSYTLDPVLPHREEIHELGPNLGQVDPAVESVHTYEFEAWYMKEQDPPADPPAPPIKTACEQLTPTSKTYEGQKRSKVEFTGRTTIDLVVEGKNGSNDSASSPQAIQIPGLTDDVYQGKIRMARRVTLDYRGRLWRFNEGVREGTYSELRSYGFGATSPVTTYPVWSQERGEPDSTWKSGPTEVEDRDFISIDVHKASFVSVDWSGTPDVAPWHLEFLPAAFNGRTLATYATDATSSHFSMPNNGKFVMGFRLPGPENSVLRPSPAIPDNPAYRVGISIFRGDRMIAIDPLMCAHLDKALEGKIGSLSKLADRRRYFADYERLYLGNTNDDRASVVPRLNWKLIADLDFDAAIAVAERLCRADDSPATIESQSPDDPPIPELTEAKTRQMAGRMTWMLTVQPEGLGSVEANWTAGKPFEVAVVIFQDRIFPKIPQSGAAVDDLDGEYAFKSQWQMADGRLHVEVPDVDDFGRPAPADEDLRQLFASGAWLLLGTAVNVTSADIEGRKAYEWVKILSAEYERPGGAKTVVKVLLDREPDESVLLPEATNDGTVQLSTFAYQGVVAVVKRSLQVKP